MQLAQHLTFAARQLRKSPGFAITVIVTLAIGIGATTAIFTLINAVLLQPLPYSHPEQLVSVSLMTFPPNAAKGAVGVPDSSSYPDFFDWRSQNHSFESMASYDTMPLILGSSGSRSAQSLTGARVSSDFFHVLQISPTLGRSFTRDEEKPGAHVAILSHDLWASTYASSPEIVGKTIQLSDEPFTVVGVLGADASFPMLANPAPSVWITPSIDAEGKNPSLQQRGWNQLSVVGRLKPGVTLGEAQADLNVLQRAIAAKYPDTDLNQYATLVVPELEDIVGNVSPALHVLFAAVAALLLIACANVAGLLLARGSARRSEISIRAALGASRAEIVWQLLVESLLLSFFGGIAGVLLAEYMVKGLMHFVPSNLPRLDHVSVDGTVLAFALATSVLTGILFGLLPARRLSMVDPADALREGSRTATAGRNKHRLHTALVVVETALGLTLLVGAGLLIRTFSHVLSSEPGFQSQHLLTFRIGLPEKRYPSDHRVQFYEQLLPRLSSLPGVQAATAAFPLPLSGGDMSITFSIQGQPTNPGNEPSARVTLAEPNLFQTLGIPLLQGRPLTIQDNQLDAPKVIVINQALARTFFPGVNPIGKRIRTGFDDSSGDKGWREIVGVTSDVKRLNLTEPAKPEYYLPFGQAPAAPLHLAVRVAGDPLSYENAIRATVASIDRDLPVYRVRTLEENIGRSTAQQRFQTLLLSAFAVVALVLAATGLYAVLSFMVVQRTHEIGLRMALGAQRSNVLRLVLLRGLIMAVMGIGLGVVASAFLARFLGSLLYGVKPLDPVTFVAVPALLLAISAAASWIPAHRASALNPMTTLRQQ